MDIKCLWEMEGMMKRLQRGTRALEYVKRYRRGISSFQIPYTSIILTTLVGLLLTTGCGPGLVEVTPTATVPLLLSQLPGRFVLQDEDGHVYIARPDGSERQDLDTVGLYLQESVYLSPTGENLAYVNDEGRIAIIDLDSLESKALTSSLSLWEENRGKSLSCQVRMAWSPDGKKLAYAPQCLHPDLERMLHVVNVEIGYDVVVTAPGADTSYIGTDFGGALCRVRAMHWAENGQDLFFVETEGFPKEIYFTGIGPFYDDCVESVIFLQRFRADGEPIGEPERVMELGTARGATTTNWGFAWGEANREEPGGPTPTAASAVILYNVETEDLNRLEVAKGEPLHRLGVSPVNSRHLWWSDKKFDEMDTLYIFTEGSQMEATWETPAEYNTRDCGVRAYWSPDGRFVLTEDSYRMWDRETMEPKRDYSYYLFDITDLVWSLDARVRFPERTHVLAWIP
jgi:hypothetical protein